MRSRTAVLLTSLLLAVGLSATAAVGNPPGDFGLDPPPAEPVATAPVQNEPVQQNTCRAYASANGYGVSCGFGSGGRTIREILAANPLPPCWLDPDLPDGFRPPFAVESAGRWFLKTCLSFDGTPGRATAVVAYEFCHDSEAPCDRLSQLTVTQIETVGLVLGRGQIPFLQAQSSPVASPRVGQPVSFSLLADDRAPGYRTPALNVAGVTMYAEVTGLRIRPEGAGGPEVTCQGPGRVMTAAELERYDPSDRSACVHTYTRSSDGAGSTASRDRYPAQVSAFWTVYVTDRDGTRPLGTYEKRSVNDVRVTEVQTLVVS